jgi:GAF domain-containing protein
VATTDPLVELLEQIQQDFGEGPCIVAYAEDRVVAAEDLRRTPRWDRIAVVVGQLQVSGVLAMPVRLEGQPIGTLNASAASPRAWSEQEIDALAVDDARVRAAKARARAAEGAAGGPDGIGPEDGGAGPGRGQHARPRAGR